ncbi:MAG: hypothetical protein ACSHX7_14920 [Luteolibacter sp.]
MKTLRIILAYTFIAPLLCLADEPKRISIAPTNDLVALMQPDRSTIGGRFPKWKVSAFYKHGWGIGAMNSFRGRLDILVIDDGHSDVDTVDSETGFPNVVLTDAVLTEELRDMVEGYNLAMHQAWTRQNQKKQNKAEMATPRNPSD